MGMSNTITKAEWTTASGKIITVSADTALTLAVDGKAVAERPLLMHTKYAGVPALARDYTWAIRAGNVITGVPVQQAEIIKQIQAEIEAARPKSRQEQYNALEATWAAAQHAADKARETAHNTDTGNGFDVARELDAKAEAARQAVIDFGNLHQADDVGND